MLKRSHAPLFLCAVYLIELSVMNRIDRLFGILTLLQSRKYVTAEKIAEKFGISIRTVYRDIKAIGETGIPLSFEQQKGYFIVPGYFIPPVSFSSEEANALLLMERLVAGFADQSIARHYSSALNKVRSVLRSHQKEKLEILDQTTSFQFPSCMINPYEYLSILQESIASRSMLEMDYKRKDEVISRRLVEPIGLVFYAFSWHLIGWCHVREAYRDFKVSRILRVCNTGKTFQKKEHISLSEYMQLLPVDF